MKRNDLRKLAYTSLLDLATDEGINASGKEGVYGCIFGRDSALTILKILRAHSIKPSLPLLEVSRKSLIRLVSLQGKQFNLESGEEPGKFIHEFRDTPEKMARLLSVEKPWYVYPDNTIKNYDSVDSTPLTLIALYKYYQITQDGEFLLEVLPSVEAGLNWIITFGDKDKDTLIEYELPEDRVHGGLPVQSWTDSHHSLMDEAGIFPKYPIAPVEAQGYAWLALRLWADFYKSQSPKFSKKLLLQAKNLKKTFNKLFIYKETLPNKSGKDDGKYFAAQALDGYKNQIKTVTGNTLLTLWATYFDGAKKESIVFDKYIKDFVDRSFMEDMFDPGAGIRTMSKSSKTYNPNEDSYHNGSFWPILNGLIFEGLENWSFKVQAKKLKEATLKPLLHFNTPIELYIRTSEGEYLEYRESNGQLGCRVQAWSAATYLELLTLSEHNSPTYLARLFLSRVTTLLLLNKITTPLEAIGIRSLFLLKDKTSSFIRGMDF
jgi:glycogen debranching enzyme